MSVAVLLTGTSRWPSPARIAIGLSKAGCRVSAVCSNGHPLRYTRAVEQKFSYSSLRPLDSLMAAIRTVQPQLLIPCDDLGVQHVHELHARALGDGPAGAAIAALIERSLGAPHSYPIVSSRYLLLKIAREQGICVPETKAIDSATDLESLYSEPSVPWVFKADGTFGGTGVRIARTREQAREKLAELSRPYRTLRVLERLVVDRDPFCLRSWWKEERPAVIAQAYIQGQPANCAAACWEGEILAVISAEVVGAIDATGPAGVVRVVDNPAMSLAAKKLASRLRLSGFFGLDFMIEDATRVPYLVEMNPRGTPLCHLRFGEGRDLIGALWTKLSSRPIRDGLPMIPSDLIAYFPRAWKHNRDLLDSSYQDIPQDDPELVEALLRPWPSRTLLFRLRQVLAAACTARKPSA